ncbi:MAG: hypothetical protein ABSC29_03725 [Minisyncoccia bacterium]|jgi:hypothetical protein
MLSALLWIVLVVLVVVMALLTVFEGLLYLALRRLSTEDRRQERQREQERERWQKWQYWQERQERRRREGSAVAIGGRQGLGPHDSDLDPKVAAEAEGDYLSVTAMAELVITAWKNGLDLGVEVDDLLYLVGAYTYARRRFLATHPGSVLPDLEQQLFMIAAGTK